MYVCCYINTLEESLVYNAPSLGAFLCVCMCEVCANVVKYASM